AGVITARSTDSSIVLMSLIFRLTTFAKATVVKKPEATCSAGGGGHMSRVSWLPPSGGRKQRHSVDLDAQPLARQPRHLYGGPRGTVRAEDARVDLVHPRELLHVDDEDAAADDVLQRRASRLEDGRDVLQHLFRLCLDGVAGEPPAGRVAAGLARD